MVFTRSPAEEAAAKVFDARQDARGNQAIARRLLEHTRRTVCRTGLPVYFSFSPQQTGDNFGERLANAVEGVFAQGHQRVLVIGNDTPEVTPALLQRAARDLDDFPLIIGPAIDGGAYLLGFRREAYHRSAFVHLAWESAEFRASLLDYARAHGHSFRLFRLLSDIDNARDLRRVWRRLPQGWLLYRQLAVYFTSLLAPTGARTRVAPRLTRPGGPSPRAPPFGPEAARYAHGTSWPRTSVIPR